MTMPTRVAGLDTLRAASNAVMLTGQARYRRRDAIAEIVWVCWPQALRCQGEVGRFCRHVSGQ